MNDDQFNFLKHVVETTGPSGYEQQTQQVWRDRVQSAADTVDTDVMGNAFAWLNRSARPLVILEAHIDEIGFQVKYIDDDGFIYFSPIGGFDASTLAGNRVRILGKNGPVLGVIGRRPIHLMTADDRKKAPELKNMWIDIGATSREEAQSLVGLGDAGGRANGVERLHGTIVAANSFDDRVGSYVVAEAFRAVAGTQPQVGVVALSAVQEEIGLRGAGPAAFGVDAQVAIAVDVTWTSDHPQAPKTELGDVRVGGGAVLGRGAATNPRVFDLLLKAAESEGLPYQVQPEAKGAGTDEFVMQTTRAGVATGLISIPTRYLHTASEVLSTDDVDGCVAIMARFVRDLTPDVNLIP